MKKTTQLCTVLAGTMLLISVGVTSSLAGETATPTADATIGIYSKYVWRGYELSKDSMVIQPSVTVGYKGIGFNLWGNLDTDQSTDLFAEDGNKWNETDMTISYDGSAGIVGYSVGYIYYALDGIADTQEVYAGISFDVPMSPSLTVYRDFDGAPGWYIALDASYSFSLMDNLDLDLGAKVSYLVVDDETTLADPSDATSAYSDFHDAVLSVSMSYAVTDKLVITPELYYSFALGSDAQDVLEAASADGDDSDFFYGGVSASFSF